MANSAVNNPKDVHPQLRDAIQRYSESADESDLRVIAYLLCQSCYLVPTDFVGHESSPGYAEAREQEVGIKTARNQHGEEALMAFTDTNALIAGCGKEAHYLTVDANTLLGWVLSFGVTGLVVNRAGPSMFFSRDDIEGILQQHHRPSSVSPSSVEIHAVRNEELVHAISLLHNNENADTQKAFTDALWGSTLILPMERSASGTSAYVMMLKTPAGVSGFPAFTDLQSAQAFGVPSGLMVFEFEAVLSMVVRYPAELFVINPGGVQIEIGKQRMQFLFEFLQQTGQRASGPSTAH